MRLLAIGDIHGCFRALTTLAEFVALSPDDLLVTLGDYVDRGPNSHAVLDWLIAWQKRGKLIPLRGNHEVMMLQARDEPEYLKEWKACGGKATLASYSPLEDGGQLSDVPDAHWQFLKSTQPWYESDSHIFVHASVYPELPLAEQPDFMIYWQQYLDPPPHESGKIVVCGHTSQKSGVPATNGHAICIDTWAHGDGWLTCLDPESGRYWQANEGGETRSDWL